MARCTAAQNAYLPPDVMPGYLGQYPRLHFGFGPFYSDGTMKNLQNYKTEPLSKAWSAPYRYGTYPAVAIPPREMVTKGIPTSGWEKSLATERDPTISGTDMATRKDMYTFTKMARNHRDRYKDHSATVHPEAYFQLANGLREPPRFDPIRAYLSHPTLFVKYERPPAESPPTRVGYSYPDWRP